MLKFKRKLILCDKDDITITVRMFTVKIDDNSLSARVVEIFFFANYVLLGFLK